MARSHNDYSVRYWKDGELVVQTDLGFAAAQALAIQGERGEIYRGPHVIWSHWSCTQGLYDRV